MSRIQVSTDKNKSSIRYTITLYTNVYIIKLDLVNQLSDVGL